MKNLEKEYKEQISHEAPDLWSRIEAGVDAYEASKAKESAVKAVEPTTETPTNITPIRKKNVIAIITRVTAVAACVLILAATVKVTMRTKSDSATAQETSYYSNETPAPTPTETQYEDSMAETTETAEPMPEAIVDADAEPSPAPIPDIIESSEKNASASDSSVIRDPVAFDDARDDLLPELEKLGFKNISDFILADDKTITQSLSEDLISDDIKLHAASFTDDVTLYKYYVIYTIDAGKADILIIKRADDTGDILYTNPSLTE